MRTVIFFAIVLLVLFLGSYIALDYAATANPQNAAQLSRTKDLIADVGNEVWVFGRPLLQLIIILYLLVWFANVFKVDFSKDQFYKHINVQAFIAVFVIVSFCIASLGGITGASGLKDITLAVVGFYFGSRANDKLTAEGAGGGGNPARR